MTDYYVTYCNEAYLVYAERLFDSFGEFSNKELIFYTIGFDYSPRNPKIKAIRYDYRHEWKIRSGKNAEFVFLKPEICKKAAEDFAGNNLCFVDVDCYFLPNSDDIFLYSNQVENYVLPYKAVHEYVLAFGRGNPFKENGEIDLSLTLEAPLMNFLGVPIERRGHYCQTGILLFNDRCLDFIKDWCYLCKYIKTHENWIELAPFHEEGILCVLLWQNNYHKKLPQVLVNIPWEKDGVVANNEILDSFCNALQNPATEERLFDTFCRIPSKDNINQVLFLHGKLEQWQHDYLKDRLFKKKKNVLMLLPHLSSGGEPAYNYFLIKKLLETGHSVFVVEWAKYSDEYVVHRNQITKLLGPSNFMSLGPLHQSEEDFSTRVSYLQQFIINNEPDIVYISNPPENFSLKPIPKDFIDFIYKKDKKWKVIESIHRSDFDYKDKTYLPDEFWFVSDFYLNKIKHLNIPAKVIEIDLPKQISDKKAARQKLGLNNSDFILIHIGLWHSNKRQDITLNLAARLLNRNFKVYFIGNKCFRGDFKQKTPPNAIELGEIDNVNDWYQAADGLILPSDKELSPICIAEALSFSLPCWISDLDSYRDKYKTNKLITFLHGDNLYNHIVKNTIEIKQDLNYLPELMQNDIKFFFWDGPKVEIIGDLPRSYLVKFIDKDSLATHYETTIQNNRWCSCNYKYYINWLITVRNLTTDDVVSHELDLRGRNIKIINESNSLGDSIAFIPAVSRFQKLHNCKVDYFTPFGNLFDYKNLTLYPYSLKDKGNDYYAVYKIGCFNDKNYLKENWQKIPLQSVPARILGIEHKEERANIIIPDIKINKSPKYVCIACQSTLQNRYYNKKGGWEEIVDYLHKLGYLVIAIDKHEKFGVEGSYNYLPKNIDQWAGNLPLDKMAHLIKNSDFVVGLSSGFSWLSWALGKNVVQISGAVSKDYEFSNPYRVQLETGCLNCFNYYKFEPNIWNLCPANKNYECTKDISFEMIKEKIDFLIQYPMFGEGKLAKENLIIKNLQ